MKKKMKKKMKSIIGGGGGGGGGGGSVMTLNQLAGFLVYCFTSKRKCAVVQIRKRLSLGWFSTCGRPSVFSENRNYPSCLVQIRTQFCLSYKPK